ncbi:hypothetical protein BKA69DRAFT_87656 [Paraphysoderma sedebokerense]|nr:hypothetical protein BKA69DRAFT_87656 [Paraphysoderma sedebokerense]
MFVPGQFPLPKVYKKSIHRYIHIFHIFEMSDVPGPPLKRKRSLEERRQSTSSFLDIIVNKHQSDDDATSPQSESSDSTQNGNDNSRTSPPASNSQSNAPSETTSQYKPTDESTQQLSTSNQPPSQNQHKPSSTQNVSHSSHQPQHHHTHHNHTNVPRSGIEPSMFNSTPIGDTLNEVARMIFDYIDDENVEIEAKLGRIIDKRTGNRLALPALCETVIRTDMLDVRFDSAMTEVIALIDGDAIMNQTCIPRIGHNT